MRIAEGRPGGLESKVRSCLGLAAGLVASGCFNPDMAPSTLGNEDPSSSTGRDSETESDGGSSSSSGATDEGSETRDDETEGTTTSPTTDDGSDRGEGPGCTGDCPCVVGDPSSCSNPDPDHCDVTCVAVGSTGTECVVAAKDDDEDGFGAACEASPPAQVDCDDGNRAVRPDATEVCNGIDDDCDGLLDLSDGLPVAGVTQTRVGQPDGAVAFNPGGGDFRWVATVRGLNGPEFTPFRTAFGNLTPTLLFPVEEFDDAGVNTGLNNAEPTLVESGGTFGVAYTRTSRAGPVAFEARFTRLDAAGNVLGTTTSLGGAGGTEPSLAALAGGGWLVALSRNIPVNANPDTQEVGAISVAGGYSADPGSLDIDLTGAPRLAATTQGSAIVWQRGSSFNNGGVGSPPDEILFARFSASQQPIGTVERLAGSGTGPDIAVVGGEYWIGWAASSGLVFEMRTFEGAPGCSGAAPFGDGVLDGGDAIDVAPMGSGALVLMTDIGGGGVGVIQVDAECGIVQVGSIPAGAGSPTPRAPSGPSLAIGGGDIAFAWTEGSNDSQFRVTPDVICN